MDLVRICSAFALLCQVIPAVGAAGTAAACESAEGCSGEDLSLLALWTNKSNKQDKWPWGTPTAAPTPAPGACTNEQGWDTDFDANMYTCGARTGFHMPHAGTCIAKLQGVSAECGTCLGELISCGKLCTVECCSGTCSGTGACHSCKTEKCAPQFQACAGVAPPFAVGSAAPAPAPSKAQSAAGGACVNQAGWDKDFTDNMYKCGLRSAGAMPVAGTCMASKQGVSAECGVCLGNLISCGKQCAMQCCAGTCPAAEACQACNNEKCTPSFQECAGVTPPTPTASKR